MFLRGLLVVLIGGSSLLACQSSSSTSNPSAASGAAVNAAPPAGHSMAPSSSVASAASEASGLTRVEDASKVCMVTNQFMGTAQIPVEVEGTTYFGCCEMCKARLASEVDTRTARDPVTGEVVDKARAIIAKDAKNAVLYFASAQNVRRYQAPL